ncbi:cytochrome c [Methylobacterium sp. JK268]
MRLRPLATLALAALLLAGAGLAALAWHPAIDPVEAQPVPDPALVRRGERLAGLGYCASCHTAEGGRPYAGGRPLATPFGTIHATNITPDPGTGIGRWSLAAFARAMREGVDREGRQLYPAFPYTHYTGLSDEDVAALYAFFASRAPVSAPATPNDLAFPFNLRPLVAGWNLLFLRARRFAPDPARDETWNRGAYLAEALSHCGACHSPRNALGAEVASRAYAGGEAEGWWAPPLAPASPAPLAWDEASLARYLRDGDPLHGGAAGPMQPVVAAHAAADDADLRALARYTAGLFAGQRAPGPVDRAVADDPALARGARIYAGACAVCHESGGGAFGGVPYTTPHLGHRTALAAPDPRNLLQVVRDGVAPRPGAVGPIMPAYGATLTAAQAADLAAYLRARFSAAPPWPDLAGTAARLWPAPPARRIADTSRETRP